MEAQRVIQSTRRRLWKQRGRYRLVAQHGRLTYSWVSKFASGEIGRRPSYDLIQRLIAALDRMDAEASVGARRKPGKACIKTQRGGGRVSRK